MNQKDIPLCQNCGMPLKTLNDFGTEADGSRSKEYCQYCYQGGKFTKAEMTMDEMIAGVAGMMVRYGTPKDKAQSDAKKLISTLKRWKK